MAAATCRAGTTLQRRFSPEAAMHSSFFSSAYALFSAGTHTVLIRQNAYMGCGTGSVADCYSNAPIAFKAITSKPSIMLRLHCQCGTLCVEVLEMHLRAW